MKRYIDETTPEMRVRKWFTADDVAWLVTRVLAWSGVGAAFGYACVIMARSVGCPV